MPARRTGFSVGRGGLPEQRDCQIMVNIETTFMALVRQVLAENKISASSYARKLILRDLMARNILTPDIMLQVMTTDSIEELQAVVLNGIHAQVEAAHAKS